MSRRFFTLSSPNSSHGGFSSYEHTRSEHKPSSMDMSAPHSSQVLHQQPRSMLHIFNLTQIRPVAMFEQEYHRQLGLVGHTISMQPPIGTPYMIPAQRNPPMMPRLFHVDGSKQMGAFTAISDIAQVGNQLQHVPTHFTMPPEASNKIAACHPKRKAVNTGLSLGSSTYSTMNEHFGFSKTYLDGVETYTRKKKKIMSSSLYKGDGNDDVVEKAAREIQFFPQELARGTSTDSEFSVYEWSSCVGGLDVTLDLSLLLSSACDGPDVAMDLSLKLNNSGT